LNNGTTCIVKHYLFTVWSFLFLNPFHTKSIFLIFVTQMLRWFRETSSTFEEQIQEKLNNFQSNIFQYLHYLWSYWPRNRL